MDPPVAYPRFDPRTSPIVGHTSFSSPSPSDGPSAPKLRAISPIHFSVVAPTLVNWHTTGARLNFAGNVIPASA